MGQQKGSKMTNGQAKNLCQRIIKQILRQEHDTFYELTLQGKNYAVYIKKGSCSLAPEPSKPHLKLKLLNKIWNQVRPPKLN